MHILLTGASSGLGEAMARFWGRDASVKLTLAARREQVMLDLAEELACQTHVVRSDLSRLEACEELVASATGAFGDVDVLVNNAGMQYVEPTVGISGDRAERLITVDLTAPLRLANLVLPAMLERRSGTIVNISSMAGITPTPGMMHYNAAKAGLGAASESLRVELQGSGVNVLTVYPGPVESPMEAEARASYAETLALRYAPTGTAEGLAKLVDVAVRKRKARVIYPRVYAIARYARVLSQWVTDRSAPPLRLEE